ncbi:MAG: hypothetical protein M5U34_41075 [Chloroflexi bacterium]|nr:hypothetical protein [Chloroflexota bacterium]
MAEFPPTLRGILDVNRPDDASLHHRLGDGAVKLVSAYGVPVFHEGGSRMWPW